MGVSRFDTSVGVACRFASTGGVPVVPIFLKLSRP